MYWGGVDSKSLEQEPESILVQGVKGGLDVHIGCVQHLLGLTPLLHQDS